MFYNTKVGPDTLPYLSYSWDTSNWLSISEICICRHLNFFTGNDYAGPVLVIFNILQVFRGEISWNCLYDAVMHVLFVWWKIFFFILHIGFKFVNVRGSTKSLKIMHKKNPKFIIMKTRKFSTKIVNFMSTRVGVL